MAEPLSPSEVAHELAHRHHKPKSERHAERVEILGAILLTIVAVATALERLPDRPLGEPAGAPLRPVQ